jgi:hypothetical protein
MNWRISLLLLAVAVAIGAAAQLDQVRLPMPSTVTETLPSLRALEALSLGYRSLAADYYWLRAISHFGDKRMNDFNYPNLAALMQRVLGLDPYFAAAYHFAGTALTLKGMDPGPSIELLEQGLKARPDDWQIPFLLGFNAYYFRGDLLTGARALAVAAKNPKAPPIAGVLATRLAAEAQAPEIGLTLIESILPTIKDDKLRAEYESRRQLLELETHLKYLNQAAVRYELANGRTPARLEDLLAPGLLTSLPSEPLGGHYYVDAEGRVRTTNDSKRLRLSPTTRGVKP